MKKEGRSTEKGENVVKLWFIAENINFGTETVYKKENVLGGRKRAKWRRINWFGRF